MGTYVLQVNIDPAIYPALKAAGYKLCIAKKVNNIYDVVWSGTDFSLGNTFNWQERYEIFCAKAFKPGALVQEITPDQDIGYGQTSLLDSNGTLNPPTGPINPSGTFCIDNEYGPCCVGIKCYLGTTFSTIFVTPNPVITGQFCFAPTVQVLVWFDLTLTTGIMFLRSIDNPIQVSYQGTQTHAIMFTANGSWTLEAFGRAIAQPRRSYNSEIGFTYEDSGVDPHTFIQGALSSDLTGNDSIHPTEEWLAECKVAFEKPEDADQARAYLKQKIIYNIHQSVSEKTDEVTFNVKLKWGPVTFMTEMMAGLTDDEKIQNAFNAELELLSVRPAASKYVPDELVRIPPAPLALLASGTHLALDREGHAEAVVGDQYRRSEHQIWKAIPIQIRGYYIIEGVKGNTYLSFAGKPKEGTPVVHTPKKTIWKVEHTQGHIRISVPGTPYCIELGGVENGKVHKIVLAKQVDDGNHQLWKLLYPLWSK